MSERAVFAVRHGATEWSKSGQHTGTTDLPLLPEGREAAAALAPVLGPIAFARVLCSPRTRAQETCRLAGLGDRMQVDEDLAEWDYGDYEGLTSDQIHASRPGWSIWTDGCPGGESPAQVAARADRVIARAVAPAAQPGSVSVPGGGAVPAGGAGSDGEPAILFGHGHILRVIALRWLALTMPQGALLSLAPATICQLGHEHGERALATWNAASIRT